MSLFNFLGEVNKLKLLKRRGWLIAGIKDAESVAEHSFRTAVMVMFLAPEDLDREKMIKMALLHELGEIDAGDITPHDNMSLDKKFKLEERTIKKLSNLLTEANSEELKSLWYEYEKQETEESKYVKQVDILEMMFQALEYEKTQGYNINKEKWTFWKYAEDKITQPELKEIYEELKKQRNS
ncbi:HD domain-containing protein [Candidatus Woesearchaeota archaeon]|nr:HD domain-containing protein [Candidatus Woesearchaeota archaeon]